MRTYAFSSLLLVLSLTLLSSCLLGQDENIPERYTLQGAAATTHHVEPLIVKPDSFGRPLNVILLIGDGMAMSQITAGLVANHGQLYISQFRHIGMMTTHPAKGFVTHSCAAATALATGHKTMNGRIGLDTKGDPLTNIREVLSANGMRTGVISTSSITHATPAGFYARQPDRNMNEEIAVDLVSSGIDLFIGGGLQYFAQRGDKTNLIAQLLQQGYYTDTQSVAPRPFIQSDSMMQHIRFAGLYANEHMQKMTEGRSDYLPMATHHAMRFLDLGDKGFFLMIEGSQIDWGGHETDTRYITEEMLDFDRAVGEALRFAIACGNTLVLVTSDHECGGMTIHNGDYETGMVEARYTHPDHTGTLVPMFAYGPGAELFNGFYDNTDLPRKIATLLGVSLPGM